jgi:uncharacterized protein (DUF2062 family)
MLLLLLLQLLRSSLFVCVLQIWVPLTAPVLHACSFEL